MASTRPLLVALCVLALFAVRSESHGLEDFTGGSAEATPAMQTFFKPEAAALPEALDGSMPAASSMAAKPEASAIPTTTATGAAATTAAPAPARRSVSVVAGVACGVAAVAVVGIAAAVAYVVRGRRGARRGTEVQLGSSP